MNSYPFPDQVQVDAVSGRRRLPATLPVDGVSGSPGYLLAPSAGKMGSVLRSFSGSDFIPQYHDQTAYDESVISNLCGTATYRQSSSDFNWKGGTGLHAFAGSSRTELVYRFDTEADPPEVRVDEVTVSIGDPLPSHPSVHTRIDSAVVGSIAIDVAGGKKTKIGGFALSVLVTVGWLTEKLDEWLGQSAAFTSATGVPLGYAGSASRSETTDGRQAAIHAGRSFISAPIASTYDDGEVYHGFSGSFRAEIRFHLRKNSPSVRDNQDSENNASDNAAYRSGSRTCTLSEEITDARFLDAYGVFDERTTTWESTGLGWRVDHRPGAYVNADGAAESFAVAGVIQLLSADGGAYRVTLQTGHRNFEEDPPPWVVDDTDTAEVSLGSPGYVRIKARPADALHVTDDEAFPDLLLRVVKIERRLADLSYTDLAVWPEAQGMLGVAPGDGVRILAMGKRRDGIRWGFRAFDGSLRYYRKKRLLKVATARTIDA